MMLVCGSLCRAFVSCLKDKTACLFRALRVVILGFGFSMGGF